MSWIRHELVKTTVAVNKLYISPGEICKLIYVVYQFGIHTTRSVNLFSLSPAIHSHEAVSRCSTYIALPNTRAKKKYRTSWMNGELVWYQDSRQRRKYGGEY